MFGITDFSFNALTGSPFLIALFLIFFLIFAIYLYRRTNPPLSGGTKIILAGLRIIAILALFLGLFEPVVSYKRIVERKPRLSLLIDRSKSMDVKEKGIARHRLVDSLLSSEKFSDFMESFDINHVEFARSIVFTETDLDSNRTALGEVITKLARREAGKSSDYWVLLSDGISNSGILPAEAAKQIKIPIYTIGIGMETVEKDVAIAGLTHNDVVFAGKPTEIKVNLEWTGMNNDHVRVEIKGGRKTLQTKTVKLQPGCLKEEVTLRFIPERSGRQTFKVSLPLIDDEVSSANNSRSFSMSILKGKLKVMLIADHLDWDYAFLNRFLECSESVELTPVVFRKNGFLTGSLPSKQSSLNQYDLVILYNVDPHRMKSKADLFHSFLYDRGGGLFIILGENYLESSFPRWLDEYLPFVSIGHNRKLIYLKYSGQPAENYLFHPAVRIADTRRGIRQAWRDLPDFEAILPIDSITPGSEILVTAGIGDKDSHFPILGCRNIGAGKVLASTAIPFWHWAFFNYGFGGDSKEYQLFIDGVVNWLSLKDDSDPIRILPDKNIFTRGEKTGFNAFIYDLGFRPINGATGHISLIGESGGDTTVVQFIETGEGKYRAEFELVSPGRYKYIGVVEKEGKRLKEISGQIAIESYSVEEFQRRPDFGTLASISQATGGDFYMLSGADSLYDDLKTEKISESYQREIILWNKFWLLAVFIIALGIEWLLRKRYQLI